jgi:hypothetical protein
MLLGFPAIQRNFIATWSKCVHVQHSTYSGNKY